MFDSARPRPSSGFTLIELLVVISIVAILMGLLFPVFKSVKESARKTQARSQIAQIITATTAYYQEYGVYPINQDQLYGGGANGSDTVYGDPNGTYSSAELFFILRAVPGGRYNIGNALNPKQVVYFRGADVKTPATPRDGFATQDALVGGNSIDQGALVDPWGAEYVVWIDATYDGDLSTALGWFYHDLSGKPSQAIAACSLGSDGGFGTAGNGNFIGSDDLASW